MVIATTARSMMMIMMMMMMMLMGMFLLFPLCENNADEIMLISSSVKKMSQFLCTENRVESTTQILIWLMAHKSNMHVLITSE